MPDKYQLRCNVVGYTYESAYAVRKLLKVHTPSLGPILWVSSVQYFIVQGIVALAWARPYSVFQYTISDLGNTACGSYRGMFVCSPWHGLMNVSFVLLGATMLTGSTLLYRNLRKSPAAFAAMSLAGIGTILVGLFPENTISELHIIGAALPFLVGNVALLLFGLLLKMPRLFRYYTIASGTVALIALLLFLTHTYIGLGIGGTERLVAYPQTIWLILFGAYILFLDRKATT